MPFPRTGLPNLITVVRQVAVGLDANDNQAYATRETVELRACRYYRDTNRENLYARQGVTVTGFVTTWCADPTEIVDADQIWLFKGQFGDDGLQFDIARAHLMMMNNRASHWEIAVGQVH